MRELLAFLVCTLIWGSTWLGIKIGHDSLPPLTAAAARFALASVMLLGIGAAFRVPLPRKRSEWGLCVFVGVVLIGIDYGLIYWAEQFLASGLTSVVFTTMTLFTPLMAAAARIERLSLAKLGAIAIAMGGVALLSYDRLDLSGARLLPVLAILGGAACAALTTVATKIYGRDVHPVALNGVSMAVGTVALFASARIAQEPLALPVTAGGWGSIAYLAIFGSVVAFLLYYWLLKRWDASRVGLVSLLTPVIALALGTAVRGEPLTPQLLAGSALVLGGVAVASSRWASVSPDDSTRAARTNPQRSSRQHL